MVELSRRNILLGVIGFLGILALPSFLEHYRFFLSGQIEVIIGRNRWDLVLLNIVGFLLFLIPLKYRRKADWQSYGIYTAFIVSLFIEMYGIPLTIFLSSSALAPANYSPEFLITFNSIGLNFGMTAWMLVGGIITTIGMLLVAWGWTTIYRTDKELVTEGIYGHSRHPQYLGIMLIGIGWFIGWPTLLTTLLLPVLVYTYYRLCLKEEREVSEQIGEEKYDSYRKNTRLLI